jgi:hypothetical protein
MFLAVKKINMRIVSIFFFVIIAVTDTFGQKLSPDIKLKVVIIRHGEKPSVGDNLCPKGLNRALALPAVLDTLTGVPDFTYIPKVNNGTETRAVRMLQTITPFAVAHNLTLNSSYKNDEIKEVAVDILKRSGVVLLVWEHSNIPELAKALGVKGKLKWKDEDFDSIWIIEFNKKTLLPTLRIEQENLKPKGVCN